MNNQIVDLILPESFDKEKAKEKLNYEYASKFYYSHLNIEDGFLEIYARDYIKELDAIENTQPKYNREFWKKVSKLNKEVLDKFNIDISIGIEQLFFYGFNDDASNDFNFHELDLINKQYRLLQEIYYSRLEGK
jgi:hypothetical protein